MKSRLLAAFAVMIVSASSFAAGLEVFSPEAFEKAVREKRSVVLGFHSPSCGSCIVQKPALDEVLRESEFSNIAGFTVPFRESTDLRNLLRVTSPSTIVVMKNDQEVARAIGTTEKSDLRELVKKGL